MIAVNDRLVSSLDKTPKGYKKSIGSFVTSEYGGSLVMDQDVNRPGYVATDFGSALDQFYADNPKVSRDPSEWLAKDRAGFESKIVGKYETIKRGTDMANRAEKLSKAGLSVLPGTLSFP